MTASPPPPRVRARPVRRFSSPKPTDDLRGSSSSHRPSPQQALRNRSLGVPDGVRLSQGQASPSTFGHQRGVTPLRPRRSRPVKVHNFHTNLKMPLWMKGLLWLQRGSGVLVIVVGGITLFVYALIVYTQQTWGKAYDQLESLNQQELQLTSAQEMLKHNLAKQAEYSQLVPPSAEANVVLEPAPARPAPPVPDDSKTRHVRHPVGY